ncbi:hypothetical protein Ct61P_06622 [Colletotrichum tofieldiae]|nr:hypothetical protein Ct61P_06622 [Colletotrichum tofieldiae]
MFVQLVDQGSMVRDWAVRVRIASQTQMMKTAAAGKVTFRDKRLWEIQGSILPGWVVQVKVACQDRRPVKVVAGTVVSRGAQFCKTQLGTPQGLMIQGRAAKVAFHDWTMAKAAADMANTPDVQP